MTASANDIIDRRRLRSKLGFWRLATLTALAVAVAAGPLWIWSQSRGGVALARETVARVEISGLITQDREMLELLEDLAEDDSVSAVILSINSPGGTTVGGETLYNATRRLAERKPVVAQVETLAASAGYMVATAGDHIVAHQTSIVGSIGVIFQYVDASELMDTVGVDVNAVKSSPLKAEPSPFQPTSEEAREMIGRLVNASYQWFVALVQERRGFNRVEALGLADGSVFTGMQGLDNGLVDGLGGEAEVRRWLEEERGLSSDFTITDREPDRDRGFWSLAGTRSMLFELVGLDGSVASLPQAFARSSGYLDGLVSLWQPPATASH